MNPLKVLILIVVIFLSTFTISACPNTVTVKGRAMRETPFGFFVGVPRTLITLYENKEPISARTSNPFGYYSFTNVHVCGQIYDVVAQSKQVDFAPNDYSFTQPPADDDSGVMIFDFVHLNDPPFNSQMFNNVSRIWPSVKEFRMNRGIRKRSDISAAFYPKHRIERRR